MNSFSFLESFKKVIKRENQNYFYEVAVDEGVSLYFPVSTKQSEYSANKFDIVHCSRLMTCNQNQIDKLWNEKKRNVSRDCRG